MTEPTETSEILAFAKTVEAKSLSRAAAELGVPRATISRRLARLEENLGVRLLRRTTRSLVLTDAGEAFLRHARIVLEAVEQAEESVRRTDDLVRGELRVSIPPISSPSFYAMLCDFARQHPEVRLSVHSSSRIVDLKRDGYDVALRASSDFEPGLVARVLARDPIIAVASPAYIAEKGEPKSVRELRKHRLLLGFARGELPQSQWPRTGGGTIHVEGTFCSNDVGLLEEAARQGLGIAMLPRLLASWGMERGELVHVLPGALEGASRVAIVYLEREFISPQVRAFVDAVAAWAPNRLVRTACEESRNAKARPAAVSRIDKPVAKKKASRRPKAA
jgi:DNA-binding transcriptional LysR family regulator